VPVFAAFKMTEVLLSEAVRLAGRPLTLRVTAPVKELLPVKVITWLAVSWEVLFAFAGLATVMVAEAGVMVKVGAEVTARVMVLLTVRPSPVAVTVTVAAEVMDAAVVAVKVNVEEPASLLNVTGLTLQEAVTPVGNPETLRVTAPL